MVFIFWYCSRATQRETLEWTALQEFFKEFSNIFRMLSLNNTTGWLLPTKPVTKWIHLLTCFNNVFDLLEKENTTSCFNFNKFNANGAAVMVHLWFLFFCLKGRLRLQICLWRFFVLRITWRDNKTVANTGKLFFCCKKLS